ncbi:tRNA (adenosine(37)-N6)-threonylcarbamoyltransferase complex dimerization subunit type 1 TsaB [soil metagenome]
MLLLAFDTATPAITVAVHDGSSVVGAAQAEGAMAHAELLTPLIQEAVLAAGARMQDLTGVAVGVGPGPFTGLRVGVVTALTLGSTLHLPTFGVCTLDIIAQDVVSDEPFVVATDARRKEVYWARYDASGARASGPAVARPADLAVEWTGPSYGRGAHLYDGVLRFAGGPLDPSAASLARAVVAERVGVLPLEPLYLRRPDAVAQASTKRA